MADDQYLEYLRHKVPYLVELKTTMELLKQNDRRKASSVQPSRSCLPPQQPPPEYGSSQGYPTQPGYPPQQPGGPPGYPPQQPGYPQQPAGYPPQQPGYPAQQPGYPQQQQPGYPQATVVVGQPTTTTIVTTSMIHVSDRPVNTQCPNCQNQVTSVVQRTMGGMVWLIAAILCIVGLWPCCLIPFCITDLYDCDHTCPVCKYHLGSFRRL
ncbi:uncharacterized protein [Amphiura filiformis]|uniref:uncharacterized protein n=1 Tax=Amphiura filiformis TaxID=82378 RepID=UPI003B216AF2